jgi:hypothetical protein
MHDRKAVVVVLCIMLLGTFPLHSQSPTATVNGQVRDTSGAVVQGADVQLIDDKTNARYPAKTNRDGIYSVTDLPPGTYHIQVSKVGFKTLVKPDILLNVLDARAINFDLPVGAISQTVTVEGGAPLVDTESAAVSTVVDRQFAENLPMNGRSFQTLIELTPGVVLTTSSYASDGQFSVNGQRADSNYWMVDGVSANIGVSTGGSDTLSGSLGGFSAQGGTNSLVSVDAMQEFRIQTSTFAPEFGRTPGGQISIVTRSGTNQFHGTVFDYFRNDVLDANNWFADNLGLTKPEERQNDFGGTLSGPILKNRTFFFFSYEGLRLRLPQTTLSTVPDVNARQTPNAPAMAQFLNAYPLPNGPEVLDQNGNPTGTAAFNASYSNRSTLDAASLRVDHKLNDKLTLFGRYNYAPSELEQRPGASLGTALSVVNTNQVPTQTATAGITWVASPLLTNDLRANYSRVSSSQAYNLDSFGGAIPFATSAVGLPSPYTSANSYISFGILSGPGVVGLNNYILETGEAGSNVQRQFNLVDGVSLQRGSHTFKFGADYRRLTPIVAPPAYSQNAYFEGVSGAQSGQLFLGNVLSGSRVPLILQNLGLFAQDTWRVRPHVTLTYGLRWDVDFTPKTSSGPSLPAVVNFNDLSALALAPPGTPEFSTRYGNVAPRVGIAYQLYQQPGWDSVLRGGWGVFYDLATSQLNVVPEYYPYGNNGPLSGQFPANPPAAPPPVSAVDASILALDPHLSSPYTQEWNVAFEQSLGASQSLSMSYVGAAGRHLLLSEDVYGPNANLASAVLEGNYGTSDYDALQLQYRRRLFQGLQALASYQWGHSIDTGSTGAGGLDYSDFYSRQLGAAANRGPSVFDVRNSASFAITYDIPNPKGNAFASAVLRGWSTENVFQARSAPPVDVNYYNNYVFAGGQIAIRPDVAPEIPLYLYGPQYPGGKAFNNTAGAVVGGCSDGSLSIGPFCPPPLDPSTGAPARQGDLGRDALRGFGVWQWDFAAHRDFPLGERLKLQFRAEFFNILNHPNFGAPDGNLSDSAFGLSTQTLAENLNSGDTGGLSPLYQLGGPRSVQFALKLTF